MLLHVRPPVGTHGKTALYKGVYEVSEAQLVPPLSLLQIDKLLVQWHPAILGFEKIEGLAALAERAGLKCEYRSEEHTRFAFIRAEATGHR